MPKVELHLHLEGAAPPSFIRGLAAEQDANLAGVFDERGSYAWDDFTGFLRCYEAATSVLRGPDEFRRLTREVLERCAEHGAIYVESFLSPDFCGGRDLSAWRDYLAAIEEGAATVPEVEMRGIVTCIRHLGPDAARETARCAAETAGAFVTGFGMGGDERMGKQGDFAWAFDCAREAGLGLTTHAGEFGGPQSVRQALDDLGVTRIGHGVRSIEDDALVDRLAEDGVTLEVCPGSNVSLGVYRRLDRHPIERLRERGVAVTVSTDDPPFFDTDLTREYEGLNAAFGWDEAMVAEVNRAAARAAFCDEATRKTLLDRLE